MKAKRRLYHRVYYDKIRRAKDGRTKRERKIKGKGTASGVENGTPPPKSS